METNHEVIPILKDEAKGHQPITNQSSNNEFKKMDDKTEVLFKSPCDNDKSSLDSNKVNVIEEKLNSIQLTKEKKKLESDFYECMAEDNQSLHKTVHDAQDSTTSEKKTIIDDYQKCKSMISKEKFRARVIAQMKMKGMEVSMVEPGNFASKYALSAPYHIFFPRIQDSKETYDQQLSITFPEILDKSLGEIVSSLQITFMLDVPWLCLQYVLAGQCADMLVLYGTKLDEKKVSSNMTIVLIEMPEFRCHHTKVMILKYKDGGIRIVVSTANLCPRDWKNAIQGLWISPHLPPLPDSAVWSAGESPTGFKKDLLYYLYAYQLKDLKDWISIVRKADFSLVNVFFVASVPGIHKSYKSNLWGHKKLAAILSKYVTLPPDAPQWPIVAESSSVGVFGHNYRSWIFNDFVCSASAQMDDFKGYPDFKFVFPTREIFLKSFDYPTGVTFLNYPAERHAQQEWFKSYLYKWKPSHEGKDRAMPHIKSYARFSPDWERIAWFVLTSANFSKAAWGKVRGLYHIGNYEVGVVFIPQFITGSTTFPVQEEKDGVPAFPIPYTVPLTKYESNDEPGQWKFEDLIELLCEGTIDPRNTVPE